MNAVEWFQLLEWHRATDTLLIEGYQVFSPARHDDGLAPGIKGSLSGSELTLLRPGPHARRRHEQGAARRTVP